MAIFETCTFRRPANESVVDPRAPPVLSNQKYDYLNPHDFRPIRILTFLQGDKSVGKM